MIFRLRLSFPASPALLSSGVDHGWIGHDPNTDEQEQQFFGGIGENY
jgi:hypothetical protein